MFWRLTMAIFGLYMKYLVSSYTRLIWAVYSGEVGVYTTVYGVTSQRIFIFIVTAMRTSNLTKDFLSPAETFCPLQFF